VLQLKSLIESNLDIDFMISESGEKVERLACELRKARVVTE